MLQSIGAILGCLVVLIQIWHLFSYTKPEAVTGIWQVKTFFASGDSYIPTGHISLTLQNSARKALQTQILEWE